MSEEEEAGNGPQAEQVNTDPAAIALALGGASRAQADAFLHDQRALIHDQRNYLREQYKRLVEQVEETGLKLWELRLGVLLRIGTLFVALVAAGALGTLMWSAAHAHGLVIESFSVPSDLASRGITGEAVAAQVLDRLTDLQKQTDSARPAQSYENNWGDNIKVEIPETGISIGELRKFLYEWLGSDTHISGEVSRTTTGIAVTVRASGYGAQTFSGSEAELDGSLQKAAEFLYGQTQPYRYANYLDRDPAAANRNQRVAQAAAIYRTLTESPNAVERAWAWDGLATQAYTIQSDSRGALSYLRKALSASPDFTIGYMALAFRERELSQTEQALADFKTTSRLLHQNSVADIDPAYVATSRNSADTWIASLQGDYGETVRLSRVGADLPNHSFTLTRSAFQWRLLTALAALHDQSAVRAALQSTDLKGLQPTPGQVLQFDAQMQNWQDILQQMGKNAQAIRVVSRAFPWVMAVIATAEAHGGNLAGAASTIAATPADCDDCLIARGTIADMQSEHGRADWWFARAVDQAPSIPFADTQWGKVLLARGDANGAIVRFRRAVRLGPHFADPLEYWGEALMAQNRSDLALIKLAQAALYAPNWGRLHLKWGEALRYAGKTQEAKKQFAIAEGLALAPAEQAEMASMQP